MRPGLELVAGACRLAERIGRADLVITGEGRIDSQTAQGKTPAGVARIARDLGVPVIAVAGTLGPGYDSVYGCGVDAVHSICTGPMTIEEAMKQTLPLLTRAGEHIARMWVIAGEKK